MKINQHGGDIYAEGIPEHVIDFSASINPYGMPGTVAQAAMQALSGCCHYPDLWCRELRRYIGKRENVPPEHIFCGGGAADILFRLLLARKPKKLLLPIPTFAEYTAAAKLAGCAIVPWQLKQQDLFDLPEAFWSAVTPDIDAVIICNPNNPTGRRIPEWLVKKGMERCAQTGTTLIIDECFHDFLDEPQTMIGELKGNPHVVLLRSYTKMYAIPGIRIGYCISSDETLLQSMYDTGAPWSVSVIAQACGIAAAQDTAYAQQTRSLLMPQKSILENGLRALGCEVIPSAANFILFRIPNVYDAAERIQKYGIMIRSCANFEGLAADWYRIAVRRAFENQKLLNAIEQVIKEVHE